MTKKKILLADDHVVVRKGLRFVLDREPDMEVVCEARDFGHVLRDFGSCHPDVVLVDLQQPQGEGLRAVRALHKLYPTLPLVVLTMYPGQAVAINCRSAIARPGL